MADASEDCTEQVSAAWDAELMQVDLIHALRCNQIWHPLRAELADMKGTCPDKEWVDARLAG
jgi:hypothetical protein